MAKLTPLQQAAAIAGIIGASAGVIGLFKWSSSSNTTTVTQQGSGFASGRDTIFNGPIQLGTGSAVTVARNTPELRSATYRRIESLSENERESLSRELYRLKSTIPNIFITASTVTPSSHDRGVFEKLFSKAGIQPMTGFQPVEGPDQVGLMLCVPDINLVPDKVKALAGILRKYGIETSYTTLDTNKIGFKIPPEIGFTLFVGPKPP